MNDQTTHSLRPSRAPDVDGRQAGTIEEGLAAHERAQLRAALGEADEPVPPVRRRALRWVLLVVVPLLVALVSALMWLHGGRFVETDNAFVQADKVPVSAEVSGAVTEVLVPENAAVEAGQLLFRVDPAPFRVAVARAEAGLGQARTDLQALRASYRQSRAQITLAQTRLEFARREQARQADLAAHHFVSASHLDDARRDVDLARQELQAQEEDAKRIAAALGGGPDVPLESHPSWRAASAQLEQARLDLARTEVRASIEGTVSHLPKPGQYVRAGATAAALVADRRPWVEANFPEKDLTWVRPGQPVEIRIDTWPGQVWQGVVDSLSPATGSEFSILPAQNASGNWVKVAQRVAVRIHLVEDTPEGVAARAGEPDAGTEKGPAGESGDGSGGASTAEPSAGSTTFPLRAGLSAIVRIDTGHRRRLLGLSF